MIRINRFACVAALLSFVALPLAPQPAEAGGRIGFTVSPKGQDAELIRTGLELYSLTRSLRKKNRARVRQQGSDNGAAIAQHGDNNNAAIFDSPVGIGFGLPPKKTCAIEKRNPTLEIGRAHV